MSNEEIEKLLKAIDKHKMRLMESIHGYVVYACSCGEVRATIGRHLRDIIEGENK